MIACRPALSTSPVTLAGAGGISAAAVPVGRRDVFARRFFCPDTVSRGPARPASGEGLFFDPATVHSGPAKAGVKFAAAGSTSDTAQRCAVCVEPGHQTKDGGRRRGETRGAQVAAPNGSGQIRGGRGPARGEAECREGRRGRGDGSARGRRRNLPPVRANTTRPARRKKSSAAGKRRVDHARDLRARAGRIRQAPTRPRSARGGACAIRRDNRRDGTNRPAACRRG